ncbi:E3 ubiquitin-protein ligase TRIM56-like [Asterias rubens]|uniref:E3 ubiquitin-protein ligase TRIM56-like n=1 Tax=Asterias rubens TaxID=7604 RepID=UPI0014553E96|nr:E3 ubiquitin-protein ligase TRIM56-like [Asterias rubens]
MQCLQQFQNPEQGTAMEKNNPRICCLCNVTFQHPKILACLHSFCLVCLQTLQSTVVKLEKWIQCPICHQKTELTETGVDGLKRNFFLGRLVDDSTLSQTLQCANILCGLCPREPALLAESRCFECAKFLCQDCQKIHNGIPSTFGHEILSLEEIRKVVHGDLDNPTPHRLKALKPRNNTLECPKHPEVKSRFFCQTCEELICHDCMVIDHPPASHSYTSLDEAAPGKRESAKNKMARLKMKLPDADSFLQASKKMSLELKSCADRAKKEVKTQALLNRERVDEEEKRLLKEIRLETQKQMRQLKEAEVEVKIMSKHIHNSLQCGGVFVEESTDSEFLWLYLVLMKDLEHLEELQLPSRMSMLSFISTEIDISLGELQKIDIAEMVTGELANKLKESTKLKYGKIDMTSPASSLESFQPHAPKETDVLQKQELEQKQETRDSSSDGPNSEAENRPIKYVPQLSKTSTLPKPISQPTGKQTVKTPSQEPSNSSASKASTSAGREKKVEKTSLPMSNVSKPPSNPTGKPTDKTPSQEPSKSTALKPSSSAGPGKKVDTTSPPIKPISQPTGKLNDKTSSQQPNNSSAPKPSSGARRKQAPLPASDRVLRSSSKSNANDERKFEETKRQAHQKRTHQPHRQSSNGKASAENNQKMVENKEPEVFREYGVQGSSMGELQSRDETDSRFPRKDGPHQEPAHSWSPDDCDSDDSDL